MGYRRSDSVNAETRQFSSPFPFFAMPDLNAQPSLPSRKGELTSADSGVGSTESSRFRMCKNKEEKDFRGGGKRELCSLKRRVLVSPDSRRDLSWWRRKWVPREGGVLENRAAEFFPEETSQCMGGVRWVALAEPSNQAH